MRKVSKRQLSELVMMLVVFVFTLVRAAHQPNLTDWHLWAFLGAGFYTAWVIGFHMKESLWKHFDVVTQKWLRRLATTTLVSIMGAVVVSSVTASAAHSTESMKGPPSCSVYHNDSPYCYCWLQESSRRVPYTLPELTCSNALPLTPTSSSMSYRG